jgi:hypothetical protein
MSLIYLRMTLDAVEKTAKRQDNSTNRQSTKAARIALPRPLLRIK